MELLLDDDADAAVRRRWDLLAEHDLPSRARHRSSSNAPHATLAMSEQWDEGVDEPLAGELAALPLPVSLGALTCFGSRRHTLVLPLVATAALLDLHARVTDLLGAPPRPFLEPGRWVPHVTLADRMEPDQVAAALPLLAGLDPVEGHVAGARHWDSEARQLHPLGPTG